MLRPRVASELPLPCSEYKAEQMTSFTRRNTALNFRQLLSTMARRILGDKTNQPGIYAPSSAKPPTNSNKLTKKDNAQYRYPQQPVVGQYSDEWRYKAPKLETPVARPFYDHRPVTPSQPITPTIVLVGSRPTAQPQTPVKNPVSAPLRPSTSHNAGLNRFRITKTLIVSLTGICLPFFGISTQTSLLKLDWY